VTEAVHTKGVDMRHHLAQAVRFSPREFVGAMRQVEGFNAKFAVLITEGVGTMACAYLFCVIALVSLPATLINANVLPATAVPHILASQGLIGIISWIAQTFIQLVLLSIILVGQRVQSLAADARAEKTFADTEQMIELMDLAKEGGLTQARDEILAAIAALPHEGTVTVSQHLGKPAV
jgi:hypothetical protein